MATSNARVSNLSQVFPFGVTVAITSNSPDVLNGGFGQVIYTDALGVCIRENSRSVFYPWANVHAAEVVK